MSAAEVIAAELLRQYGEEPLDNGFEVGSAAELLDALKAAGYAVVELPTVAHKGPNDTDAMFFRQVADRMDDATKSVNYLSGSNVRYAVRQLLYRAADAAEATR